MPDHHGLDTMPFLLGGKAGTFSPLEKIERNFDHMEPAHNIHNEPKRSVTFGHHLMGEMSTANSWRTTNHDVASMSKLYNQSSSLSVECGKVATNGGYYENGLFSSSMSDIFNKKRGLISNDVLVGQSGNTTQSNYAEGEAFESLEKIEAQTIGDLLPDDDDLLSGAIDNHGRVAQSNWTDVEDDLFCSVGGMELESDDNISYSSKMTSEIDYGRIFNGLERGLTKLQPSRMLLVKNIDSNIEDMELRVIFEQYGDIRALYTSCRHHGFIMVSYYDVRAAQNAIKTIQTKKINGQKLDVQFYTSKENQSENDISDGMLLVTIFETSVSNDDLIHIFSAYGEIKEICDTPQNRHRKIIEFFDVRAAEAALLALNRWDVTGRRVQVEPCSIQKVSLNRDEDETSSRRQEIYSKNWPSECFGTSTNHRNGATHGPVDPEFLKITSSIPRNMPSQARVSVIGNSDNQSVNTELSHSLGKMNIGLQSRASFPEFCDGVLSATQFNSPNTMSAMAINMNSTLVANGIDSRSMQRVGSMGQSSHSFEHHKSALSSGIGSCPPHSHEYIWNNSHAYHHQPGSMAWQNMPPFLSNNNIPAQNLYVHGLSRGPSHMPNPILTPNQHVGSAPSVAFHTNSLGSMGYSSCSPLHSLDFSSHNLFPHPGGPGIETSNSSTHVGTPSSQPRAHIYRAKNNMTASNRSRRSHSNSNQSDSSRQYELDVERITRGEDLRTTLMIKNIPNKYTSKMLLATIDEQHKGTYDFIYLPIDFKNKCNVGYAFINMTDPQHIIPFYQVFNGKKWEKFNSEKVAYLAYARIQGKAALIGHFQNSSLMNEDKRCRPIIFRTDGPNAGDQEPFPVPVGVNVRFRRSRTNTENHEGSSSGSSSEDEFSNSAKESE